MGTLHNGDHAFHLILSEFSSPLAEVKVCSHQHHTSTSSIHTFNGSDGKVHFLLPTDVGVGYLQNG
jgi:hypothetical protein